jgi:hypothetical protein
LTPTATERRIPSTAPQSFDSHGNLLSSFTATDYNGDGTVDYITSTIQSFDSRGNRLSSVHGYDWNADGTVDYIDSLNTQSFDNNGKLLSSVLAYDNDATAVDYVSSTFDSHRPAH